LDFGIAKLLDARATTSLTMDGRVCGSPAYMSPEQCKAIDVDFRCDIYSLAVVIFETLTGRRPFDGADAMSVMFAHVNEQSPTLASVRPDPGFTPELEAVLQRALNKEPSKRQASMHDFWEDLSDAVLGKPESEEAPAKGWIAFSTGTSRKISAASELQAALDIDLIQEGVKPKKEGMYLHEFRRKQREFFARVAFCLGVVILGYMLLDNHKEKSADETIETLTMHGRPEDAVRFLEKLRQSKQLSMDDMERLNNAYMKSAEKLAKRKQYADAVDMLQRVGSKSKYSSEAKGLMKKYKSKLSNS
jgi:hypothetical protein